MKERTQTNIGTTKCQAELMSYDFEHLLWEKGVLGKHNPEILRKTVLFLVGIYCSLRAGDEHYDLRRDSKDKPSQFSFEHNKKGECCVIYREDKNQTK